jgi:hypothetical protein
MVAKFEEEGYKYSYDESPENGILVFIKMEEVKGKFKD